MKNKLILLLFILAACTKQPQQVSSQDSTQGRLPVIKSKPEQPSMADMLLEDDRRDNAASFVLLVNRGLVPIKPIIPLEIQRQRIIMHPAIPGDMHAQDEEWCYDAGMGEFQPCGGGGSIDGSYTVMCTGTFNAYNTIGTVVAVLTIDNQTNTITNIGLAYGGFGGTFTNVGGVVQEKAPDGSYISYTQVVQETQPIPSATNYSQVYAIYGTVYDKRCNVRGKRIVAQ